MKLPKVWLLTAILLITAIAYTASDAHSSESSVLRALEAVRSSTEIGISYNEFARLLADVKTEISLESRKSKNPKFLNMATAGFNHYVNALNGWKRKIQSPPEYAAQCDEYIRDQFAKASAAIDAAYSAAK